MKFYYITNIFDLHTFDNETSTLLKIFEISKEMHFVSLFFLNGRNITTSLLIKHLNCAVLQYAKLNSSSINKPYLRVIQYDVFLFLIYVYFNHGTIIRTGITCKKIPCYMRDSACSWLIVEKAKIF